MSATRPSGARRVLLAFALAGCSGDGEASLPRDASPPDLAIVDGATAPPRDQSIPDSVDLAMTTPMDLAMTTPMDMAASMPVDLAMNMPVDLAATIPMDMASSMPVDLAMNVPVDLAAAPSRDLGSPPDLAASPDLAMACTPRKTTFDWNAPIAGWNDPFADRVVSVVYGASAGFGQNQLPRIVLGPPEGAGANLGSLDVLSLGQDGVIVLALDDVFIADGPGPDLLVFENSTTFFKETGWVAVSEDGQTWHEWPCSPQDAAHNYPGCAGPNPVYANSMNKLDPTNPAVAGGNAFDLADLGMSRARYVRIRDSGFNHYVAPSGGFDLDAIAVINGEAIGCY